MLPSHRRKPAAHAAAFGPVLVVPKASIAGLRAPVAGGQGKAGAPPRDPPCITWAVVFAGEWLLPSISHLKPAANCWLWVCLSKRNRLCPLLVPPHTPAIFLGLFSAWTKPVAELISSQLLLEQHCLSFAPLYLHSTLQLQGFPLSLFLLGLLVCPVNDDGCLECQALQESTGMAKAMTNTSPKLHRQPSGLTVPSHLPGQGSPGPWCKDSFPSAAYGSHPCYTLPTALPDCSGPWVVVSLCSRELQGSPGIMCEWGLSSPPPLFDLS